MAVSSLARGPARTGPRVTPGQSEMIGQPIALIQVPNQRLFSVGAAAQYLGCNRKTLWKWTAEGRLHAKHENGHRLYTLEALDSFIDSLPAWKDNPSGRDSASAREEQRV